MTFKTTNVPEYGLYGVDDPLEFEEFFHCETIAIRSRVYEWEISSHAHPALSQMLFVASGEAQVRLGDSEERMAGPFMVGVPCGSAHGFRFSSDVVGFVVTVSQDYIDGLSRHDALRLQMQHRTVYALPLPLTERLMEIGRQLLIAERERFAPNANRLHRALAEAWLRTAIQPGLDQGVVHGSLAQKFQSLVEISFREHKPLSFYADRLNCTARTLSRQVALALDMTPLQFINRRMLFEARRLLRFTNASCAEVAAELGFEDPSYFSRFYLRMTGHRPTAEKARLRQE